MVPNTPKCALLAAIVSAGIAMPRDVTTTSSGIARFMRILHTGWTPDRE
jgi:hypothetical protein